MLIDRKEGIELTAEFLQQHSNEFNCLNTLFVGLEHLYQFVRRQEEMITPEQLFEGAPEEVKQMFSGQDYRGFVMGNAPGMEKVPRDLIRCCFHWYAVSACNYVRTVCWMAKINDKEFDVAKYLKCVIPKVKNYRDKVGAHLAGTCKNKKDNEADRLASTLHQVTFANGHFFDCPMTVTRTRGGQSSESTPMSWSLTTEHEALRERYWSTAPPISEEPSKE